MNAGCEARRMKVNDNWNSQRQWQGQEDPAAIVLAFATNTTLYPSAIGDTIIIILLRRGFQFPIFETVERQTQRIGLIISIHSAQPTGPRVG
jgi:hypothetical protein